MATTQRPGWVTFAAVMMFGISGFALVAALNGFMNPDWINYTNIGFTWNLMWFGIFDLLNSLAALYAGYDILKGGRGGFLIGILFATLSAIRWFLLMPAFPLLSVTMVTVWILVTYGLVSNEGYFKDKYLDENSQEADAQSA